MLKAVGFTDEDLDAEIEALRNRQVKNAQNGLTVNFGGFGNNVLAFVLKRVEQ